MVEEGLVGMVEVRLVEVWLVGRLVGVWLVGMVEG